MSGSYEDCVGLTLRQVVVEARADLRGFVESGDEVDRSPLLHLVERESRVLVLPANHRGETHVEDALLWLGDPRLRYKTSRGLRAGACR